jgi:hypothetical protein
MPITFGVDDVIRAPELPPTQALSEHLGDVLAFGGDGSKRVLGGTSDCPHPLLGAIHVAFAEHRPLVLSPDAVWLTILRGVAQHVHLNAEALRPRLVRHHGKRRLTVTIGESLEHRPAAIREAIAGFRAALAEEIGSGLTRLLTCDFSTTSDVERAASEILLMDTYSHYFDLAVHCVCGIPEITLSGEAADWRAIRQRIDVLAELDLTWWTSSLAPILDEFVAASDGRPNAAFFRDIYKPQDAYGWDIISGWSARFYPYTAGEGRFDVRNPLLEHPLDYRPPHEPGQSLYQGPGIRAKDVSSGVGSCIVEVDDRITGQRYKLQVRGGLVGVEVDDHGRLAPCAGWTVRRSEPNICVVIDQLRGRTDFIAAPVEPRLDWMPFAVRDLVALADAFGAARLFVGSHEWLLRAPSQMQFIEISLPGSNYPRTVCRVVDLPDGSFLAYADLAQGRSCLVRLLESQLELLTFPAVDPVTGLSIANGVRLHGQSTHLTRQALEDIDVVGDSLAALLERALATNGALPEAVSKLSDAALE